MNKHRNHYNAKKFNISNSNNTISNYSYDSIADINSSIDNQNKKFLLFNYMYNHFQLILLQIKDQYKFIKSKIYIPSQSDVMNYLRFCGPLFVILLTKTIMWTYTTYACSTAGAIDLATHQVIYLYIICI